MSIESLLIEQARLSDLRRELKAKGCEEASKCTRRAPIKANGQLQPLMVGSSCIDEIYSNYRDALPEAGFYGETPSFDDAWNDSVEEGEVCHHCIKVRLLKRQRVKTSIHLGGVRAAITRVGRRLAKEQTA